MAESSLVSGFFKVPAVARLTKLPRGRVLGLSVGASCFVIAFLTLVLPKDSQMAVFLLDYTKFSSFPYPFTIQNLMYLLFAVCIGELFIRSWAAKQELKFLGQHFLPEDDHSVLRAKDLGEIRQRVAHQFTADTGILPYLINLCILQFQASRSVDQAVSVMNSSLDLISHKVDLNYSLTRYIVWAIPTVGFIGTVVGIANALGFVNPDHMDLGQVTGSLSVAFNTTIIALVLSAILVLLQHIVQTSEELAMNRAGDYCLRNLINRLYVEKQAAA
ncbi:MAG: MotA/TolQ/ExbB proton channel family protein [Bdellovibrionales bacterium]|nr:MotA/TolQ/ExbB proton channel family protein [Bdellovibrionales bacterium]